MYIKDETHTIVLVVSDLVSVSAYVGLRIHPYTYIHVQAADEFNETHNVTEKSVTSLVLALANASSPQQYPLQSMLPMDLNTLTYIIENTVSFMWSMQTSPAGHTLIQVAVLRTFRLYAYIHIHVRAYTYIYVYIFIHI